MNPQFNPAQLIAHGLQVVIASLIAWLILHGSVAPSTAAMVAQISAGAVLALGALAFHSLRQWVDLKNPALSPLVDTIDAALGDTVAQTKVTATVSVAPAPASNVANAPSATVATLASVTKAAVMLALFSSLFAAGAGCTSQAASPATLLTESRDVLNTAEADLASAETNHLIPAADAPGVKASILAARKLWQAAYAAQGQSTFTGLLAVAQAAIDDVKLFQAAYIPQPAATQPTTSPSSTAPGAGAGAGQPGAP